MPMPAIPGRADNVEETAQRSSLRTQRLALDTGPEDTPYGRMATVKDPTGAAFKLIGVAD